MTATATSRVSHRSAGPFSSIVVRNLSKTYRGGVEALRDVSFEVRAGEAFGLLGPNGAGKTTTIGILTTTTRASGGEVFVGGFDVSSQALQARKVSGIVFQDSVLDTALSGRANLTLHARLWGMPKDRATARMDELIDAMGLAEVIDRPTRTYSGGQRRRLEIARGVLGEPQVLFLDEPTVGLDPTIRYELWSLIERVRAEREMTIVLTTHYLDEAERLCDRIAIMHLGRIVALDRPAALLSALGEDMLEVRTADATAHLTALLADAGIPVDGAFELGSLLTVPLRNGHATRAPQVLREAGADVRSLTVRRPTLDDVYLRLTGATLGS